jgi:hypothetical protein
LAQRFKCLKHIPVARYQPAGAALDISDSPETIQLRLEDKVRVIERRTESRPCQGHRCHVREIQLFSAFLAIGLNSPSVL